MTPPHTIAVDLAKLLDHGVAPIYVLDEERRIVFCNRACARWTRLRPSELVGQQCVFKTPVDETGPASVAAGLCPPPRTFAGVAQSGLVHCLAKDGRLVYRRGHFFPLGEGKDESAEVIAILEPADCTPQLPTNAAEMDAQLHEQVARFRTTWRARYRVDSLIGMSPVIVRARAQVELAGEVASSIFILGPAGAGKEHVAKAIHYAVADPGTLVPLDCAVLETNLLRSTLRALAQKNKTSTAQQSGTLLLSESDSLAAEVQADLLELLSTGALRMRLISTSTRPLATVDEFSSELACALTTLTIELPALTARLEDLPLLAQTFLEEANSQSGKQLGGFTPEALDRLAEYAWPGNVEELRSIVREAHEQSQGGEVQASDLRGQIEWAAAAASHPRRTEEPIVLEEFLAGVEKELIARAMRRAKGNKSKLPARLG